MIKINESKLPEILSITSQHGRVSYVSKKQILGELNEVAIQMNKTLDVVNLEGQELLDAIADFIMSPFKGTFTAKYKAFL